MPFPAPNQQRQSTIISVIYLDILAVVETRYALHQMRRRVIAEVRAYVADTQATAAGHQITRVIIRAFVQDCYLERYTLTPV